MKKIECEGVGDNDGFFELEVKASPKERIVMFSISDFEIAELSGPVPLAIQLRQKLNKAGFKFEDDNKFSSIVNENPKPLGKFISWRDIEDNTTNYRQILRT
tara:strand:- start:51 stop:356 length:306 start_codon:yes stop_codon:yes gene_type:complete